MTKTSRILACMTVVVAAAGSEAGAQTTPAPADKGFLNINVGAQPPQRAIATSETRPVFGETATISTSQGIKNGPMFDVTGGYRVWHRLAFGIGFSRFSSTSDGNVVAAIPSPLFFNQLKTVTATQTGLVHSENGIHLQAVWLIPVTTKFDVSVAVGPSFIAVSQDVPAVTIPAGTQTLSVTTGSEQATAKGVNVGFDLNYLFTRNYGAGLFLRYAGGHVDLPSAPGLSVGGLQAGIGARIRF